METDAVARMKTVTKRKKAMTVMGILIVLLLSACAGKTDNKQAYEPANTDESGKDENLQVEAVEENTYWLNRHGEIYESSYAPAGLDKTFATMLWIATHQGEIVGEHLPDGDFPCIAESEQIREAAAEGQDTGDVPGAVFHVWVRIVQEPFQATEGSFGQTAHKDTILYRDGEDLYVAFQSVEDTGKWTVSRIAGYGDWLEKELGIFIQMTTGLGLQESESAIAEDYYDAITRLENTGFLPDDSYCYVSNGKDFHTQKQSAYPNQFAVYDLDGDGIKELCIKIGGTCTRDNAQYVYRYSQEKSFELIFSYYDGCDFYEDGLILARVSHAQFMYEDDFWPYEIFRFNADQDKYESIANVEQIDLKANPDYLDFPHEYDKDDDQKVYIVNFYGKKYYYDEDAYDDWKKELLGSKLIELNFTRL